LILQYYFITVKDSYKKLVTLFNTVTMHYADLKMELNLLWTSRC